MKVSTATCQPSVNDRPRLPALKRSRDFSIGVPRREAETVQMIWTLRRGPFENRPPASKANSHLGSAAGAQVSTNTAVVRLFASTALLPRFLLACGALLLFDQVCVQQNATGWTGPLQNIFSASLPSGPRLWEANDSGSLLPVFAGATKT